MRFAIGIATAAAVLLVAATSASAGPNPEVKLAMHLVASNAYLYCEDLAPPTPEDINDDLTIEELAASDYCGYLVFLAYDIEVGISAVEYFVTGWPMGRGAPLFSGPTYCPWALCMGNPFEASGGEGAICAFGECLGCPPPGMHSFAYILFDLSAHTDYLPIDVRYDPSSYSYPGWPHNYVLACPDHDFAEDLFLKEYDCTIGIGLPERTIELLVPNGGETWYAGSTPPIEWMSHMVEIVQIEYSTDGGLTWQVTDESVPSTGFHLWTVPDTPSSNCLVRLTDAVHGEPSDVSEAPFTIASESPRLVHVPSEWPCIQYGIYGAAPGDTVVVAPGVYPESVRMKNDVSVRSEAGPCMTTIDGTGFQNVVVFANTGPDCSIEGFRIQGGDASGYSGEETVGGGVFFNSASGTVRNCIVSGNRAAWWGGGIGGQWICHVVVEQCLIIGNHSNEEGGGLSLWGGTLDLSSSTIADNTCGSWGGGAYFYNSGEKTIHHSIIAFNERGGICGVAPTLTCCDIYGNTIGPGSIEPQIGINGNFAEDPMFCPEEGDYHLLSESPCADGYGCGLIGAYDVGCTGPSVIEKVTWGEIKEKFRTKD
jgi:hypothetical protein